MLAALQGDTTVHLTRPQAGEFALRSGTPTAAERGKLHEIAKGFEAVFASVLLSELLQPLGEGGLAGTGPGASVVQGLIEQHLSDHLSQAGGFGLAKVVEQTLLPTLATKHVTADEVHDLAQEGGSR